MNLFYQPGIREGRLYLDEIESKHCTRVLRKKSGDAIQVTDGTGSIYECIIEDPDHRRCTFKVASTHHEPEKKYHIHIAIAPTKNQERLEWFVEKAVEIGVDQISFIECQRSERRSLKIDRINKVAISAMKQSQRATLPVINTPIELRQFLERVTEPEKFIAYVDRQNPYHLQSLAKKQTSSLVLVGPEGDFSDEEIELALKKAFKKISLGTARLRTETAGLAACHILNLINEQ